MNVLPARDVLDDKGCWWEWDLALAGWNDLPADRKVGVVTGRYGGTGELRVEFRGLSPAVTVVVFPGEVRPAS